ncbi:MAG: phospholipase D-like domain-containing protein [Tsuneonella sp.]
MGAADSEEGGWNDPPAFRVTAQGHELSFFPAGADRKRALLDLIASARTSLQLCFYIFATDETAVLVRDALTDAVRRGVAVTLMIDSFGAAADEAFFRPFIEAGGDYCCFSPRFTQRYLIRNHQKIAIADGTRAMLGGFNIEDAYFAGPSDAGWTDLGVIVEGPVVRELVRWYEQLLAWTQDPGAQWHAMRRMVRDWQPASGRVRLLIGGPTKGLSSWARCVGADLVRGQRLDMIMAYFTPPNRMMRWIGRLARRGTARLVMAGKSDNPATVGAARALYDYLLKRRTEVWEFTACRLHTKLVVIDDAVYFGSANFDMRSLYLNLELMVRIEDPLLAERMREFIAEHLAASQRITPVLHRRRSSLWNRIRWNISWFLVFGVDYTVTRRLNLGL